MKSLPYKRKFIISQIFLNPSNRYVSGVHLGVDLVGLEDKNIYAIEDGIVVTAYYDSAFGNTVVVQQRNGLYSRYSHLEAIKVISGQTVIGGFTVIGIEGKTGNVVGSGDTRHLDLRISKVPYHTNNVNQYYNPCEYLGFPNKLYHVVTPEGDKMEKIQNVILCYSEIDRRAAGYLADHLKCKIIEPDLLPTSVLNDLFENIYVIGSSAKPVAKAINIYGKDRYETCLKVINKIQEARG
ncbi:MAG: M23 family metallopeptidase [Peptococcaceae bacterium]|nr:M23 family metallopeptidase [Peptococcaceae bacterium]